MLSCTRSCNARIHLLQLGRSQLKDPVYRFQFAILLCLLLMLICHPVFVLVLVRLAFCSGALGLLTQISRRIKNHYRGGKDDAFAAPWSTLCRYYRRHLRFKFQTVALNRTVRQRHIMRHSSISLYLKRFLLLTKLASVTSVQTKYQP